MAKIKTTSDLRQFLCNTINGVANGTFDINKAREITKLAAQINESLYSEVRVAKTQLELGKESAAMGELQIGTSSESDN